MEIILGIFFLLMILGAVFILICLKFDLYFLLLKIENHPVLIDMVENVVTTICKEEGIQVFHKPFDELNADVQEEGKKATGMYVYFIDKEMQQKAKDNLIEIDNLENEFKLSYKEICKIRGFDTDVKKEDFMFPKILLCYDKLLAYGLNDYYSTYFHELGHHFAIKEISSRSEEDADKYGRELILKHLPFFFQLFPYFRFTYRLDLKELGLKEKIKGSIDYLKYYIKNRKTIVKKWQKNS